MIDVMACSEDEVGGRGKGGEVTGSERALMILWGNKFQVEKAC